jgi:hypothetical protein
LRVINEVSGYARAVAEIRTYRELKPRHHFQRITAGESVWILDDPWCELSVGTTRYSRRG